MVATACREGRIVISGMTNGMILADIRAHADPITCLTFSGNGNKLLSSSRDSKMIVWELKEQWGGLETDHDGDTVADHLPVSFKSLQVFKPTEYDTINGISSCAIDPRGCIAVAGCLNGRVCIWEISTGNAIHFVRVSDLSVTSLNFADDGRYFIAGSADGYVTVIEASKGQVVRHLHGNSSGITSAYFEHGGVGGSELADARLISVCSRQAVTWQLTKTDGVILQSAGCIFSRALMLAGLMFKAVSAECS